MTNQDCVSVLDALRRDKASSLKGLTEELERVRARGGSVPHLTEAVNRIAHEVQALDYARDFLKRDEVAHG